MKNTFLFLGFLLIVLNTISGLILENYATHKMIFGDISIALTTAIIYLNYQLKYADGFKIGFTLLYGISGMVRFICALISSSELKNNFSLLVFILIFCLECLILFIGHSMKNK